MAESNVKKVVPPLLFNFIAWILGLSTDPEQSQFVDVGERISL